MKKWSWLIPILVITPVLVLCLFSTGCDQILNISGTIYEWADASGQTQSKIYHKDYTAKGLLNENLPEGINLKPLSGAHIQCFGAISRNSFYNNEVSDENGRFQMLIKLGRQSSEFTTTVEATHEGFYSAKRDFTDRGDSHMLNIVMVRTPNSVKSSP